MGCTRTPLRLLVAATLVNIVLIIEVPQIESQRVGSETHVRKWVMLDEINTDVLERSYVWEDRTPIGTFSSVFTSKIQSSLIALASEAGGVRSASRVEASAFTDTPRSDARRRNSSQNGVSRLTDVR